MSTEDQIGRVVPAEPETPTSVTDPRRAKAAAKPAPPKSSGQWYYERSVLPGLKALGERLKKRGMSMALVIEFEPGKRGTVTVLCPDSMSAAMATMVTAVESRGNIDKFVMDVGKLVEGEMLPHNSAILRAIGIHPDPAKREAHAKVDERVTKGIADAAESPEPGSVDGELAAA